MSDQWNKPDEPGEDKGEKKEEHSASDPSPEGYTADAGAIREDEEHNDALSEDTSPHTPLSFSTLKPREEEKKEESKAGTPAAAEQNPPMPPPLP
ncbi:MAG: hypothetical protein JJU11_10495, partial [Candidatus Sumerlaeia bacterium]|nr:hypothetical protein [Candidatus Sumerlaeia bacterium]